MYSGRSTYYRRGGSKYSNETITSHLSLTQDTAANTAFPVQNSGQANQYTGVIIVPATNISGNRKVKNFSIKVVAARNDAPIYGALVYVPEGTEAKKFGVGQLQQSMYEPNQNVICSFVLPPTATRDLQTGVVLTAEAPGVVTVRNRLARNLSQGDSIALVYCTPSTLKSALSAGDETVIDAQVNYAIKF